MTSLIGARRRAEEFDAALSSRTPSTSPELDSLLSMVDALRSHEAPAPRADFSASLREQLMVEAAEVLTPATPLALPPRRRGARERRLTAAASAFVLIGGTAGMAAAAQHSAPGDALYPIKRGTQSIQRAIQRDDAGRGHQYLDQAGDRLDEARTLVDRDATSAEISRSLTTFRTQAQTGSDLLLDSFAEEQDAALVREVRAFSADALASLEALSKVAPADLSDEIAKVGFVLERIDANAADACIDCSDLPALEVPAGMQLTAEIQRATKRVQMAKIDNSHPAAAVKLPTATPTKTPGTGGKDATGGDGAGTGTGVLPPVGVKENELPKDPKELLGAVDDATGGLLGSVGDTVDGVVPGATDDLLP
jgi:hypothetical protein